MASELIGQFLVLLNEVYEFQINDLIALLSTIITGISSVLFRQTRRLRTRNSNQQNNSDQPVRRIQHSDLAGRYSPSHLVDLAINHRHNYDDDYESEYLNDSDYDEDEPIDPEEDLDRIFLESIFEMPNLWLKPNLISLDYLYHLPTWQFEQYVIHNEIGYITEQYTTCSSDDNSEESEDSHKHPQQHSTHSSKSNKRLVGVSGVSGRSTRTTHSSNTTTTTNIKNMMIVNEDTCCPTASQTNKADCSTMVVVGMPDDNDTVMVDHVRARKKHHLIRLATKRHNTSRRRKHHRSVVDDATIIKSTTRTMDMSNERPDWMLDMTDCTVCFEKYRTGDNLCGLPCGHNYHVQCIGEWLTRDHHCCPICRWPSYRFVHPRHKQFL